MVLIRMNRVLDNGLLLKRKPLKQWFLVVKGNSSLRTFYGCHYDLVNGITDGHDIAQRVALVEHELLTLSSCCFVPFWSVYYMSFDLLVL